MNKYSSRFFSAGPLLYRILRRSIPLLCAGLLLLLSAGCSRPGTEKGIIQLFYLNGEKTGLLSRSYEPRKESTDDKVREILDLLTRDLPEEGMIAPIKGFSCEKYSIQDNTITLEFTGDYRSLNTITEKLIRAAVVNTLCGLDEIRRVTIRANGALLMDEQGNKSENMTSDQFIYSTGGDMLNFENAEIHLYFASEDGKKLVETYRNVVYNPNIPMERLVVEQIIAGPRGGFNYPTVNENTKVVNTLTRDDTCTVTLDKTFLTSPYKVEPEVAIYSIVNSLCEIQTVRQVQILIDGVEAPVFMNSYVLDADTLLQKNNDLIQSRE